MKFWNREKKATYDSEIDSVLTRLREVDPANEDYKTIVDNLKTISEAKAAVETNGVHLDPNQILKVAAYLAGMGLVMKYEELRVITGKAFGFLTKIL